MGESLIIFMELCQFALGLYTSCLPSPQATCNLRQMLFFNRLGVLGALLSILAHFGDEPDSSLLTKSTSKGLSPLVVLIGGNRDKLEDTCNCTLSSAVNTHMSQA